MDDTPQLTWHKTPGARFYGSHYDGLTPEGNKWASVHRHDDVSDGHIGRWTGSWRGSRGRVPTATLTEFKIAAQSAYTRWLRSIEEAEALAAEALAKGAGPLTEADFRVVYSRQVRRSAQPKHVAIYDWRTDPDNRLRIRMDTTLCNIYAANHPESADLSTANCAHCLAKLRKLLKRT
jgi:hypothetical protein